MNHFPHLLGLIRPPPPPPLLLSLLLQSLPLAADGMHAVRFGDADTLPP